MLRINSTPHWDNEYVASSLATSQHSHLVRAQLPNSPLLQNNIEALRRIVAEIFVTPLVLRTAISPLLGRTGATREATEHLLAELIQARWIEERFEAPYFDRPVFIISAPRAGSTLLFEQLSKLHGIWTIGGESHQIFDSALNHKVTNPHFESIRATEFDATPQRTEFIKRRISLQLRSSNQEGFMDMPKEHRPQSLRFLDKLPKNSFRVPFLNASFPGAKFIYLSREPQGNIGSIIDAWHESKRSGRFITYPELPGTSFKNWCLVLPPGWRAMLQKELADIAAYQWAMANDTALDDLSRLNLDSWCTVAYSDFVACPASELRRLCEFIEVEHDFKGVVNPPLKLARSVVTPPNPDKWRKHQQEIERVLPAVAATTRRIANVLKERMPTTGRH